jgi:hypothetical protein
MGQTDWFELAVEAQIPETFKSEYPKLRYEVRIGIQEETQELAILTEALWFIREETAMRSVSFPIPLDPPDRITQGSGSQPIGWRKIVEKQAGGIDCFQSETSDWNSKFRTGTERSALGNLIEDQDRFPVATWFKDYLSRHIQKIQLNSESMRSTSPFSSRCTFQPDGSSLPWVIYDLEENHPTRLRKWIDHVQTASPDLTNIRTVEMPENRSRYLKVEYQSGLKAPAWIVSEGTLRLLALTILAYIPDFTGVYLIEEPENGLHPLTLETVLDSLHSVYDGQVFVAIHSSMLMTFMEPEELLCFSRTDEGTAIVNGKYHPHLRNWQHDIHLSTFFASGVLGWTEADLTRMAAGKGIFEKGRS